MLLGSAYGFDAPPLISPRMSIGRAGSLLHMDWSEGFDNFRLEYNTNLLTTNWFSVTPTPTTSSLDIAPTNTLQFFRLRKL